MTTLVDTDWLIDILAGRADAIATMDTLRDGGLAVSAVTIGEILDGAYGAPNSAERSQIYRNFLAGFTCLDVTFAVADRFGQLRATLRHRGDLIPDLDLIIAATALTYDLTLVTRNTRHFARIPGLVLYERD